MEPKEISEIKMWWKWIKANPIKAFSYFCLLTICAIILFPLLTNYFGEKGKQLANPLPVTNPLNQTKKIPLSSLSEQKNKDKPIKNFASRYTLSADMTIRQDYVHINGINVRGDVNVKDSEGVELRNMKIFKSDEIKHKGKINIDRSREFRLKKNVVANEINVDRSNSFDVEKNIVGEITDHDKQAQDKINVILLETSHPEDVMSSLITIQKLVSDDNVIANALGRRVQRLDKKNEGRYKTIIITHLKKLEIDTLKKAKAKNVGMVFHWLDFFIDIQ